MSGRDGKRLEMCQAGRQLGLFEPVEAVVNGPIVPARALTADRSPQFNCQRIVLPKFEQRLIMLLDMDAFFASAEQVARPELKGKPVIVGGLAGDRSVVASASYEARALGVKTAMPIAQAHRICPQGVFLRGSYALYSEFSRKVIDICNTFTPLVEQASIDEAYLDLAGTERLYSGQGDGETGRRGDAGTRRRGDRQEGQRLTRWQGDKVEQPRQGRVASGEWRETATTDKVQQQQGETVATEGRSPFPPATTTTKTRLKAELQTTTRLKPVLQTLLSAPGVNTPANSAGVVPEDAIAPCNWPATLAEMLLQTIRAQTGLGASISIGSNKLIARIAMESAKPGGVCFVWPGYEAVFLADKPLKAIPGIGPQTAAMLEDYNLRTAGDVQKTDKALLIATFGERLGQMLHDCAWGRGSSRLELQREQKSISRDTSFEEDTTDMGFIKSMLYYLTERACRTLRRMDEAAWTVSVKLRYSDFQTVSKSRTMEEPNCHDDTIYKVAEDLLEKLYTRQISIRLVGVQLSGLVSAGQIQMNLWDPRYLRQGRLYEASDLIRDRFGFCALMKGPAIDLMGKMEKDHAGLRLRTSCLTK